MGRNVLSKPNVKIGQMKFTRLEPNVAISCYSILINTKNCSVQHQMAYVMIPIGLLLITLQNTGIPITALDHVQFQDMDVRPAVIRNISNARRTMKESAFTPTWFVTVTSIVMRDRMRVLIFVMFLT